MSERTFWLVIVLPKGGGPQLEVSPHPDNRKTARHIASVNQKMGHVAYVVKRHEWTAA